MQTLIGVSSAVAVDGVVSKSNSVVSRPAWHGEAARTAAAIAAASESWFALWTRSRHEQVVCEQLTVKGIESFLPTVTRVSQWKDRRKRINWPLFPGYCFARFRPADLLAVHKCTGVVTVLSNSAGPIAVPTPEVEALQRLMQSGLACDPCELLEAGTLVRIVAGPLAGVVGRLIRKGTQEQLVLAVDLLHSGARVQVSAQDIQPLGQDN